jgi:CheY-like chemotaxis protein
MSPNITAFYCKFKYINMDVSKNKIQSQQDLKSADNQDIVILVVEDDFFSHSFLDALLSDKNYTLLHAWDGKEAITQVEKNPSIALVLMDINMPKVDGFGALSKIKGVRPKLPIIAQTAYAFSHDKEKVLKAGFDRYIAKPIDPTELFGLMDELLLSVKGDSNV